MMGSLSLIALYHIFHGQHFRPITSSFQHQPALLLLNTNCFFPNFSPMVEVCTTILQLQVSFNAFVCSQVTRLALMNSKLTQSLSMHNLATSFDSDSDNSASSTPQAITPSQSELALNLTNFSASTLSLQRTNSNQ